MESRNRGYVSVLSTNVIANVRVNANGSHTRTYSNINTSIVENAIANVIVVLAAVPLGTTIGGQLECSKSRVLIVLICEIFKLC